MIVCWAIASPICGYLSDRIGRRKPIYLGGAVIAAAGWATLFYAPLPLAAFTVVAAITSFACGAVVLGFAFAKESVPVQFLGTISGAINVGNMIGPTLLQPAIGRVLDQRWAGTLADGVRVYPVDAFQAGVRDDRRLGRALVPAHRLAPGRRAAAPTRVKRVRYARMA